MLTKKFVIRSFTFKLHVKVWSCNRPLTRNISTLTDIHIKRLIYCYGPCKLSVYGKR